MTPPAVVVGVDGSAAATRAALWGAAEARQRDAVLHLVYALDPADAGPGADDSSRRADAESALRQAHSAVREAVGDIPVKVEVSRGSPVEVLRRASNNAALLCTGIRGLRHFSDGHTGSTAAAVARSAHCPVAVIHDRDHRLTDESGGVVAEVDGSPDSEKVIALAVEEALLRRAPLRVLTSCHSRTCSEEEATMAAARLERQLAPWRRRHPELDITALVAHEPYVDYLTKHANTTQLAITATHNIGELLGGGQATLHGSGGSVLIANPRRM